MILARENGADALRSDLARHPELEDFGEATNLWTGCVSLLARAVRLRTTPASLLRDLLKSIVRQPGGRDVLRTQADHRLVRELYHSARTLDADRFASTLRALAARMEDAGALAMADTALQMLLQLEFEGHALTQEEQGRVIAHRARIARQAGEFELAREQYANVERLARSTRSDELFARAWIGFAVLAMLRGNFPESGEWFERGARAADSAGVSELSRNAHHGCLIVAAKRDDFDAAVLHGWLAFRSSAGDPALEAEALSNIGGVLATARQYRTAQAAFSAALRRRPPARMAVPALGGSVLTSARLGDAAGTRAAYAELLRHAASADHRYEITDALVDAALALQLIGDRMEAERARARAREMAAEGAFHELAFRAEQPLEETEEGAQAPSMPAPLSDETRDICQRVEQLDSADLLQGAHA